MNHLGLNCLGKVRVDVPFVTVVTDMITIHPLWICPKVTRCIVPTETAGDFAARFGMPSEKIEVCGQPVGLKFTKILENKWAIRHKLNLELNRPTVLIMGGGEGMKRVFDIARTLAQTVPRVQLLIIAGRNKALKDKLEATAWEIPAQIYGFVDNVPELMKASDILITKAGPGTISEAFVAGLPTLIFGYIPGQEKSNVTYVQERQAGVYAETPEKIAQLVLRWTSSSNTTLQTMARNAAKLANPTASLRIASSVCKLI